MAFGSNSRGLHSVQASVVLWCSLWCDECVQIMIVWSGYCAVSRAGPVTFM